MGLYLIWLIRRGDRTLFLYNSWSPASLIEGLEGEKIQGFYGTEPGLEDSERLKRELYDLARQGAEAKEIDRQFPLQFVFSLGVFLFSYFFFSYVVRDPLPLVDELVLSFLAAGLFWVWRRGRIKRGPRVRRIQSEGYSLVDRIQLNKSGFLQELELFLESLEDRSPAVLFEDLLQRRVLFRPSAGDKNSRLVREDLALFLGEKKVRKGRALVRNWRKTPPSDFEAAGRRLTQAAGDMVLFALHESLGD